MYRSITISLMVLAIAGFATAGTIDGGGAPAVYTSSDGVVFANDLAETTSTTSILSGASAIPVNDTQFSIPANGGKINPDSISVSPGATGTCSPTNLFGDTQLDCDGSNNYDDFIFANQSGNTFTVTFGTNTPVTIYGFSIFLGGQLNGARTVGQVELENDTTTTQVTNDTISLQSNGAYTLQTVAGQILELTDTFAAQTGSSFTFTFVSPNTMTSNGPRIWDIQSLDSPVPEPGTWMLGGLGMMGLLIGASVRNRRARSNA